MAERDENTKSMAAATAPPEERSEALQLFVPRKAEEIVKINYKTVEIHSTIDELPIMLEQSFNKASIMFRVDKDIELFGFQLYGCRSEDNLERRPFVISAHFRVYNHKKVLMDSFSSEINGSVFPARICFAFPYSKAFEANKWHRIDFKIKGSQLVYGKGLLSANSVTDLSETVKFEFKRGTSLGKVSALMFDTLGVDNEARTRHERAKCQYNVTRYDYVGFSALVNKSRGSVTFLVSKPIALSALIFYGPKSDRSHGGDPCLQKVSFEVRECVTDNLVFQNPFTPFESCKGAEVFEIPAFKPIMLEEDTIYLLSFRVEGPKLRSGVNSRRMVTVEGTCPCRANKEIGSVTFTFIEEENSSQLKGLKFRFLD